MGIVGVRLLFPTFFFWVETTTKNKKYLFLARCSVTTFILSTPWVRTCVGCSRKAFLPPSTHKELPTIAQVWVVEELLEAVHRCLFCNNGFVSILWTHGTSPSFEFFYFHLKRSEVTQRRIDLILNRGLSGSVVTYDIFLWFLPRFGGHSRKELTKQGLSGLLGHRSHIRL